MRAGAPLASCLILCLTLPAGAGGKHLDNPAGSGPPKGQLAPDRLAFELMGAYLAEPLNWQSAFAYSGQRIEHGYDLMAVEPAIMALATGPERSRLLELAQGRLLLLARRLPGSYLDRSVDNCLELSSGTRYATVLRTRVGKIYEALSRPDRAMRLYSSAIAADETAAEARFRLAVLLERSGQNYQEAARQYALAGRAAPGAGRLARLVARLSIRQNDLAWLLKDALVRASTAAPEAAETQSRQ